MTIEQVVLGSGSASTGDRLTPALALAASGLPEYLVFDRVGEPTLAKAQQEKLEDPSKGHDSQTREVAEKFAPYMAKGLRMIGSFGLANLDAAVKEAAIGLSSSDRGSNVPIGVIRGDDVKEQIVRKNILLPELGCRAQDLGDSLVSANAYIGADGILTLLEEGARFIIGGRICDASLAVGAICHSLGWSSDRWDDMAAATLVGHLLTGGPGLTGGGFADPPYRTVPNLHDLGFGMATVRREEFVLSKLPDTGGTIRTDVVKSRIAYEVHDPAAYLTPDVSADFSQVEVTQVDEDLVSVRGLCGRPRPDTYRILVGIDQGWKAVGEISFGGPGCIGRAKLGEEIARRRLTELGGDIRDVRFDYFGYNALFGDSYQTCEPADVRLRVTAHCRSVEAARMVCHVAGYLYWGPAGGGAPHSYVDRAVGVTEAFLPRSDVPIETEVVRP